jgi:hypothetical protein
MYLIASIPEMVDCERMPLGVASVAAGAACVCDGRWQTLGIIESCHLGAGFVFSESSL